MIKYTFLKSLLIGLFVSTLIFSCDCNKEKEQSIDKVILLIGDGMGTTQLYAGMTKSKVPFNIERSQYCGFSKTHSATSYITDSGAGGTAISTGIRTKNYAIAVDTNDNHLKTIVEFAIDRGLSTGVVASCNLTHATPASFVAHQPSRKNAVEIAQDYLKNNVDVLIGGGKTVFDTLGVALQMADKGYQVTYDLDSIDLSSDERIACFVANNHPKKIIEGRGDMLPKATGIALEKLNQNSEGFFLMVEGSQIDWAGHNNDISYLTSEVIDFDKAVGVAYDFADNNPGTLVIVTADHETGGLILPGQSIQGDTVKAVFASKGHTGVMVPVFGYGTGAENFSQIMKNTDLFEKLMVALELN